MEEHYRERVVVVSRIVWDWVVPWLVPRDLLVVAPTCAYTRGYSLKHAVTMCRIGEGVFPLVGRACRSLMSYYQKYGVVVEAAAEAGAASCVDWLVRDRKATGGRRCDDYGNDAGGLEGLEGDMTTTRGRKEFVRVLGGLCRGGHLAMAQRLVDGHWPGLVWPASDSDSASASGNAGDCGDVELVDHVRASKKIMKRVCKKGHLDVVKWMTERFHIREPWEFLSPLNGALSGGHLEVAQWMASTFDLVSQFSKYNFLDAHSHACRSENLAVVKWCFENFPVNRTKFGILNFLAGKTSGCVKVCEYITPHIIVPSNRLGHELAGIRRVDVLHWASLTFPLFTPVGEIEAFCEEKGGLDVVKALVEEHSIKPSPEMFRASCRNKKDSVPLVKWLSTMLRLSPKDLCDSFAVAVGHSNTSIAAWLDDTFGVLKLAPPATILEKVCREMPAFEERVEGLKWLLKCPAMMVGESESSIIMESLEHLVYQKFVKTAPLLIIEKFHVHEPPHSALLNSLLTASAQVDRLSQVKKIVSLGEFTKDAVTDALLNGFGCASTKSAKWFITHFQLERDHITGNQNMLLERLVSLGQENCAEWLINKFHITLDEFLSIYWPSSLWNFDLFAWKMILRVFPAITTTAIRQNLTTEHTFSTTQITSSCMLPMTNNTSVTTTDDEYHTRVVTMSRIVWESVLPWLVPRRLIDGVPAQSALVAEKLKYAVTMCCVGEGMFPLVGRMCRSLLSHHEKYYTAMEAAAEAGATSCVDWLVSDRKRNATQQRAVADTMASSSAAGGDDWDEERCVRRGNKEFIHVLGGLCCGGHLGMAMRLVDGRWPGITWQTDRSGGDSIAARAGLEQHVRDSAILVRVCRQGQLEVAKWMVERFNIREPWELARPFADALYKGQLRVAQWIVSAFNVIHTFESFDQWMCIHECACRSENLAVVKWCFETFPVHEPYTTESILFAVCTYAKRSSGADVLKFFIENFVIPTDEICPHSRFGRVDILKCVTSLSDSFNPSKEDLARYCKEKGGLELVKYAVEEYPLKLTAKEFTAACRNKLDDVGIMQWLSTKVTLSPKDLRDSLVAALAQNNTLIASWLDATFGIMRQLTSWNSTASSILVGVCKGMCAWKWKGRLEGVMWLVNHSEMRCVEESEVLEAIKELVSKESFPTVTLLLIEKFSIKEPHRTKLMASLLKISAQSCSLPTVKKVAAMGTFTKETVAQCLSGTCLLSSKTVKWLVTHFQLERAHIVLNKQILVNLLSLGKENCAEWLINRFHITLDEMLGNALKIYWERIDLFVWKMLIRKFPGLTSTFLKKMCLKLLLQSPVSVHFVRSFFPDISMNDIVDFCSHQTYFDFPLVTRYWLRSVAPQIWDKNSS